MLSGDLSVKQASLSDCVSFDVRAFEQNGLASAEVNVSRRKVFEALMVAPVIEVIGERCDPCPRITG